MIDTVVFEGFAADGTIAMPANWPEVCRSIDNLAELKVLQLVMWVTWGAGRADELVPLTLEDFAEVTGLSIQSVRSGIDRALLHGYIERLEQGRERYYGIKLLQVQDVSTKSEETAPEADSCEVQDVSTFSSSSNEFERYNQSNITGEVIRIQLEETVDSCPEAEHPCKGELSRQDNATLCCRVESLSKALGDAEHIAPNIGRTRKILARYLASGGEFETFLMLMYDARDAARRKTKIRMPNRMPYFFTCLQNACQAVELAA